MRGNKSVFCRLPCSSSSICFSFARVPLLSLRRHRTVLPFSILHGRVSTTVATTSLTCRTGLTVASRAKSHRSTPSTESFTQQAYPISPASSVTPSLNDIVSQGVAVRSHGEHCSSGDGHGGFREKEKWKKRGSGVYWLHTAKQRIARLLYGILHPCPCPRSAPSWVVDTYAMSHGHIFPDTFLYDVHSLYQAAVLARRTGELRGGREEEERKGREKKEHQKGNEEGQEGHGRTPLVSSSSFSFMDGSSFIREFSGTRKMFEEAITHTPGMVLVLFYTAGWGEEREGTNGAHREKGGVGHTGEHTAFPSLCGFGSRSPPAPHVETTTAVTASSPVACSVNSEEKQEINGGGKEETGSPFVSQDRIAQRQRNRTELERIFSLLPSFSSSSLEEEKMARDASDALPLPISPSSPDSTIPSLQLWSMNLYATPDHMEVGGLYDVRETPMWVGYRDGHFVGRVEGAHPELLLSLLESLVLCKTSPTERQFE